MCDPFPCEPHYHNYSRRFSKEAIYLIFQVEYNCGSYNSSRSVILRYLVKNY